ncbi:aa3-type cytochrome c oxidase subunit IV [Roseivivax sediminis]|uniref:Aa3 type cytochrome c oxidase subunit IV n=1 Tax=Roseivivax sediminis TaxID=936889 RepID=A0A1I2DSV2_9RHOB|nr:aa3-type cytochrome c oxidase subunit IV [Roseivivax sediminis]SFE83537.1 aa3 type cytochrome c oxidase subunit IV [Roseivivax sediminis]
MAEHKHGEMDITTQKKTFDGFVTFTVRSVVVIAVLVVLLALVGA